MRIGTAECLVILAVVLLIFGPKQLPKVTEALKQSMEHLRGDKKEDEGQVIDR